MNPAMQNRPKTATCAAQREPRRALLLGACITPSKVKNVVAVSFDMAP
jgi:hypothetical protein